MVCDVWNLLILQVRFITLKICPGVCLTYNSLKTAPLGLNPFLHILLSESIGSEIFTLAWFDRLTNIYLDTS